MTVFKTIDRGECAALGVVAGLTSLSLLSGLLLLFDVNDDLPRVAQALFEPAQAELGCPSNDRSGDHCRVVGIDPALAIPALP